MKKRKIKKKSCMCELMLREVLADVKEIEWKIRGALAHGKKRKGS